MTTTKDVLEQIRKLEDTIQRYVQQASAPGTYDKIASDLISVGFSCKKDMSFEKTVEVNGIDYIVFIVTLDEGVALLYERHVIIEDKGRVYSAPFSRTIQGYQHVLSAIRDRAHVVTNIIEKEMQRGESNG